MTFPAREKKALKRKYEKYFGDGKWRGSIFDLYLQFLEQQEEKGKAVEVPENSFDVYDLAALAYLYKRIKENDPVREASHVVIDEAQDFGMMAYQVLHYCLRDCTYTIMGDTSQNIHFSYGLNDWEELKKLILTGTYDAFGVLRKSYRNTVEISDFANEILRHGDFAIYPVEPVLRHGTAVRKEAFDDEAALLAAGVQTIKTWQAQGYETIAVVCRDEAEAADTARKLKQYVTVVEEDLETAEFGEGVMVLPVAYTKGLEFDAVLLLDPTEEKYPENDGQVKLLYVAATRALHELAVLYTGELTGILAKEAPKGRHNQEFAMETLTKAKEYEKVSLTQKEAREENRAIGIQEMDERNSHGPKRIVIKPEQRPGMALGNTSTTGTAVMAKGSTATRRAAAACTGRGVIYFCWCGLSWKGRRQSAGKQTECRNTGRNAIWNGHGRSAECKKTGRSRYGTRRSREDGAPEYLTLRFRCNPGKRAAAHQGPFEDQVCGEMGEERKIGG